MIQFRTISQLVNLYILPEINKRIQSGKINKNKLPLELFCFRIIQKKGKNKKIIPIVELNEEVKIKVTVKIKKRVKKGELLTIDDIYPEETYIIPPTFNNKPAAYFLGISILFGYDLIFDCLPNLTNIKREEINKLKPKYPILQYLNNKSFNNNVKPLEKIQIISKNNWPPSPGYYPQVLLELHNDPRLINKSKFVHIVSKAYNKNYFNSRLNFWKETNFFPERIQYLESSINSHFSNDYISSIYVLVPQFEGIVRDYLKSCKMNDCNGFINNISKLHKLILSRKILMFPRKILDIIFDYLKNGTFWKHTTSISNPQTTINRHGILHGIFTGFECKEISLKYLILLDSLFFVILHDKMLNGTI